MIYNKSGEKSSDFFFTYDKSMYIMNIYYKGKGEILMSYIRKTFNIPGDIVSAIEIYQKDNSITTFTGAMLELIRKGLKK